MTSKQSLVYEIRKELSRDFLPPRTFLNTLVLNSVISFIFFLVSYLIGSYNEELLRIAATTVLLWTLADSSLTNQLIFDKPRTKSELKNNGTLKRLFLSKNLTVAILSIPITIAYGLLLVTITGKWSDIIYGVIMAFILIWGWLGVSNMMSVILPFQQINIKNNRHNKKVLIKYGFLYVLPWFLLPVYVAILSLPFILLGWTRADATNNHRLTTLLILFIGSILIWIFGLIFADRYTKKPNTRIKNLLDN